MYSGTQIHAYLHDQVPYRTKLWCKKIIIPDWNGKETSLLSLAQTMKSVPIHVDAAAGAKRVEAVEDPVTGDLDTPHWKNRLMVKAEIPVGFHSETAMDNE